MPQADQKTIDSYRSPKTAIRPSPIHGRGLFAILPIAGGEIVANKRGHVYSGRTLRAISDRIDESYIQIDDDLFMGALTADEVPGNKLFINHSCDPNLGIQVRSVFVAMRDIAAGEELTFDWAMEDTVSAPVACRCGSPQCRGTIAGGDWQQLELQLRYRGFFSHYIQRKIDMARRA